MLRRRSLAESLHRNSRWVDHLLVAGGLTLGGCLNHFEVEAAEATCLLLLKDVWAERLIELMGVVQMPIQRREEGQFGSCWE